MRLPRIPEADLQKFDEAAPEQKARMIAGNVLTGSRLLIGAFVLSRAVAGIEATWVDAGAVAAFGATDYLDGKITRITNPDTGKDATTLTGAKLDPFTDHWGLLMIELAGVIRDNSGDRSQSAANLGARVLRDLYVTNSRETTSELIDEIASEFPTEDITSLVESIKADIWGKGNTTARIISAGYANSPLGRTHRGMRSALDRSVTVTTVASGANKARVLSSARQRFYADLASRGLNIQRP
jgi:phosphatidylglycerophosphate synthase